MVLPPDDPKWTKKDILKFMKEHGWSYNTEKIIQHFVYVGSNKITMQEILYVPAKFKCPNAKHGRSNYLFLKLFPSGVYLVCARRGCRIATGAVSPNTAEARQKRPVEITYAEAIQWEKREGQSGLSGKLAKWADDHNIFDDEEEF